VQYVTTAELGALLGDRADPARVQTAVDAANQLIDQWTPGGAVAPAGPANLLTPGQVGLDDPETAAWAPGSTSATANTQMTLIDEAEAPRGKAMRLTPGEEWASVGAMPAPPAPVTGTYPVTVRAHMRSSSPGTYRIHATFETGHGVAVAYAEAYTELLTPDYATRWLPVAATFVAPTGTVAPAVVRTELGRNGGMGPTDTVDIMAPGVMVNDDGNWYFPGEEPVPGPAPTAVQHQAALELGQTLYRRHAATGGFVGVDQMLARLPADLVNPIRDLLDTDTHAWGLA
jgi:hypothetical protein